MMKLLTVLLLLPSLSAVLSPAAFGQDLPDTLPYGFIEPPVSNPIVVAIDARTVRLLVEAMEQETYPPLKAQLVAELGRTSSLQANKALQSLLKHDDETVRAAAVRSLVMVGTNDDVRPAARDPSVRVRREVANAATFGSANTDDLVTTMLQDADPTVVVAASRGLRGDQQLSVLRTALPKLSTTQRAEVIRHIGRTNTPTMAALVEPDLQAKSPLLRAAAVEAIARLRAPSAEAAVRAASTDASSLLRRAGATAAQFLDASPRVEILRGLLSDDQGTVRQAAADAVQPEDAALSGILAGMMDDTYVLARQAAIDSLVTLGQPGIDAAAADLTAADAAARAGAAEVLGRTKSETAYDTLVTLLQDQSPRVVREAARAVGVIGRAETIPQLQTAYERMPSTSSDLEQLRALEQIIVALAYLGDESLPAKTTPMIASKTIATNVRAASAFAAGRLGDKSATGALTSRLSDEEESIDVIVEATKALGQMRAKVERKIEEAPLSLADDYVRHWALQRIRGTNAPWDPPADLRTPEISMQSLEK